MSKTLAFATGVAALAAVVALVAVQVAGASAHSATAGPPGHAGACHLANGIKHVIYVQFDNTHLFRDRQQYESDLEQMPHLLNFLRNDGTLDDNDHTVLISHTSNGILSSLTGLYPDRNGVTVGNSYRYYNDTTGHSSTSSSSAFKYWTDKVDDTNGTADSLPNMVNGDSGTPKNTPAPWVPYTRAGCNVGGVGIANIELENLGLGKFGDIAQAFGNPSPQATEAASNPHLAQTDFVGIAVHCAKDNSVCKNSSNPEPDQLPDEPGGYAGYQALFGAKYVDPAITNGNPCVNNTNGQPIQDPDGNCGFPGFDGMEADNTLGYVAQMQENGVPVTFSYISDAHDMHTADTASDAFDSSATGPGEAPYVKQLHDYDQAFANFFQNLAQHGITKRNSLFVITVEENDHYAGGQSWDGTWSHTFCNVTGGQQCPANQIGEVDDNINSTIPSGEAPFLVHSDSAPAYYVTPQQPRTAAPIRKLERDVGAATAVDPYEGNNTVPLTLWEVDPVGERAIHMVNADPNRTPTFTQFANPDFFLSTFNTNCPDSAHSVAECVAPGFAWNHGDATADIGRTWLGLVGPGVKNLGQTSEIWSDHTDFQPTMLALTGLKDDYKPDGRVLWEALDGRAGDIHGGPGTRDAVIDLAQVYKQLQGPFAQFGSDALTASTKALESGNSSDDSSYTSIESQLDDLTNQRNSLAAQMRTLLYDAAFGGGPPVSKNQAENLANQGRSLLQQADTLAGS
jgi:hypothetical protein